MESVKHLTILPVVLARIRSDMKLVGVQFKCRKGHIWESDGAKAWTEMPCCPKCYKADWKNINHIEPAKSWQGVFDPPLPKPKCNLRKRFFTIEKEIR